MTYAAMTWRHQALLDGSTIVSMPVINTAEPVGATHVHVAAAGPLTPLLWRTITGRTRRTVTWVARFGAGHATTSILFTCIAETWTRPRRKLQRGPNVADDSAESGRHPPRPPRSPPLGHTPAATARLIPCGRSAASLNVLAEGHHAELMKCNIGWNFRVAIYFRTGPMPCTESEGPSKLSPSDALPSIRVKDSAFPVEKMPSNVASPSGTLA